MAALVWITAVVIVALVFLFAGAADYVLSWDGMRTITNWLRQHPLWFYIPAGILILFLIVLGLHIARLLPFWP